MKRIFFIMTIGLVFCNFNMGIAQTCVSCTFVSDTTVRTPMKSTVQDTYTLTSGEIYFTPGELAAYVATINSFGAVLIELPTAQYNCHGYAWHVTEGGSKVWIGRYDFTSEDIYWTDGSYIAVPESIASKVSYHEEGNHSAIKLDSYWYQSKWGWGGGLVKHTLTGIDPNYKPSKTKIFYKKASPPPPSITISGPTSINYLSSGLYSTNLGGTWVEWWFREENGSPVMVCNYPTLKLLSMKAGPFLSSSSPLDEDDDNTRQPPPTATYYLQAHYGNSSSGDYPIQALGDVILCPACVNASPPNNPPFAESTLIVYPNPTGDILHIEIVPTDPSILDSTYDIRLYDSQGNLWRNASTQGNGLELNVSNLPNGNYFLHVYDGISEKPKMRQIMVQH